MKGRQEQRLNTEKRLDIILNNTPQVFKDYMLAFGDKTFNTKNNYIRVVIRFYNYMIDKYNYNFEDVNCLKNISFIHIQSYLSSLNTKNTEDENGNVNSVRLAMYALKHFFEYLKMCNYITYNPCDSMKPPKDKTDRQIVYLTEEEVKIMKDNILTGVGTHRQIAYASKWKTRDLCILSIGITTGMRVSAIRNINIEDIDFKNMTISTIEKGGFSRKIYISEQVVSMLHEYIVDRDNILGDVKCEALFISNRQSRIGVKTIERLIHKFSYNIEKKITPHKMRSTAASYLYQKTGDIYLVADVLGHHNIQNTKRYAAIPTDTKKDAAKTMSALL